LGTIAVSIVIVVRERGLSEVAPSPDLTVVPPENFFREAELNFTNAQLLLLKSNSDTLQS
jgi:hypothetical protein